MDLSLVEQLHTQLDQVKEQAISWEAKEAAAKKSYEAMKDLAKQNVEALDSKIILDVGGTLFSTTKDTLIRVKDSYFTCMLESGHWKPQKDGSYFIDRDPEFFRLILKYMRFNLLDTTGLSEIQKQMLQIDFDYFFPSPKSVMDLAAANLCSNYLETLKRWLKKPSFDASSLLWRGSTDGFTAKAFHDRCDNKGSTLTVIQSSEGWLFGGYNPSNWTSAKTYSNALNAFLFTLTNPHNIKPTQYFCQSNSAYNHTNFGPSFGTNDHGCDLTVFWNGNATSYTNLGSASYVDTTGFGKETFTGNPQFELKEIEVFAI